MSWPSNRGSALIAFVEGGRLILEERGHLLRRLQAAVRAGLPAGVDLAGELAAERPTAAIAEAGPADAPARLPAPGRSHRSPRRR